jgi:hypothetical protein
VSQLALERGFNFFLSEKKKKLVFLPLLPLLLLCILLHVLLLAPVLLASVLLAPVLLTLLLLSLFSPFVLVLALVTRVFLVFRN